MVIPPCWTSSLSLKVVRDMIFIKNDPQEGFKMSVQPSGFFHFVCNIRQILKVGVIFSNSYISSVLLSFSMNFCTVHLYTFYFRLNIFWCCKYPFLNEFGVCFLEPSFFAI